MKKNNKTNNLNVSLTKFVEKSSDTRGVSNTPLVSTNLRNFCIDYFSMVINESFTFDSPTMNLLFSALKIDKNKYTLCAQHNGYKTTLCYEEFIYISYGGTTTSSYDQETIHLELKGQGCRKFEELGGNWIDLLECAVKFGKMKRLDIAYDDFTGCLDYMKLIDKTINHEYSSVCKSLPVIMFSKDGNEFKSFSITFGSRTSARQLQIYDKKTEREAKNYKVLNLKSWTRIEARFKDKFADEIKDLVLISLYNKNFDVIAKGLIRNIVEYKEKRDEKNAGRVKNWGVWDNLLKDSERIDVKCQYDLEKTITKKANRMKRSVSKTLKMIYLSNPSNFYDFINFLLSTDLDKLENTDLSVVNNAKNKYETNVSYDDLKQMVDCLTDNLEGYSSPDEYIESLVGTILGG